MADTLPRSTPPHIRAAIAEATARLSAIYGPRLARVVLYGSYARGDAGPDSDVDLLLVLRGDVEPYTEIRRTGELALDLLLDHGADVSIQPYGIRDAEDERRPFVRNVLADGVTL
ncbi:nucleotidyltransferase domain-containing protein [Rubrivirga sp.]|uniref:nucleotidyltransferase domain-containing protein n=1 Tax=Rubrivirga sp. TaxID=1885344 RepID=UPI003B52A6EF